MSDKPAAANDSSNPVVRIAPYLGHEAEWDVGGGQMTVIIRNNEKKHLTLAEIYFALHSVTLQFDDELRKPL